MRHFFSITVCYGKYYRIMAPVCFELSQFLFISLILLRSASDRACSDGSAFQDERENDVPYYSMSSIAPMIGRCSKKKINLLTT